MKNRGIVYTSALIFVLAARIVGATQTQPIIDPDPNGAGYSAAIGSRPLPANLRSSSAPTTVVATIGGPGATAPVLVGSKSYQFTIPIVHLNGRNGMDLDINCYYNSAVWGLNPTGRSLVFNIDRDFPAYGFRCDFGYVERDTLGDQFILTDSDGAKHAIPNNGLGNYDSLDGTYINYDFLTNIATYRNGTRVQYAAFPSQSPVSPKLFRPVSITDRNGNYFSIAYVSGGADQQIASVSDSRGKVIAYNYDAQGRLTSLTQSVHTYTDPSGTKTYATFTWGTVALNYNYSLAVSNSPASGTNINVITKCTYPNGTAYAFTYGDWGIVKRIDHLSSTGVIQNYMSYDYPASSAGALADVPAFTQKTASPDGVTAYTWNYSFATPTLGAVSSLTVTDPNGNRRVTNTEMSTGLISSIQFQNSAGTTLQTTSYTWTVSGLGKVPATVTRTLNDSGQQSSLQYTYDANGNVTTLKEFDWGNVLKRQTVKSYLGGAYLIRHILNLPTQVLVKDAAGTIIARTDLDYDTTALALVSGAANHDDTNYSATFTTRGNLTSTTRYSNAAAATGAITRTMTYNTLGEVITAQDDCCVQKTFNYSSTTDYAFPDSVVRGPSAGPQFAVSYTYNLDNGLMFTSTDENSQVTALQYDSMNRLTQTTPPSPAAQTTLIFGDSAASPTVMESTTANSRTTVNTYDGAGELLRTDSQNGSTLISSITYAYDGVGQRVSVSNPFAPGSSAVNTTIAYDAIGRETLLTPPNNGSTQTVYYGNSTTVTDPSGKQHRTFTNMAGRLVEVDEPGWGDAVKATGTVGIIASSYTGGDQYYCLLIQNGRCFGQIWDTGTVSITVNGVTKTVTYGKFSTTTTIAAALAAAFHNDANAPADATSQGTVVTLTARTAGAIGNSYAVTGSSMTNDPNNFSRSAFFAAPTTATLTNGMDMVPQGSPTLTRPLVTTYVYDALNNVTSSSQAAMLLLNGAPVAGQPRTFIFDSLGRLTSSNTPEKGLETKFYTTAGGAACAGDPAKVCRSQDARGVVTTFTYDAINRPTGVSYSDGSPGQTMTYDTGGAGAYALGRLTQITDGANSQTLAYDNLGRTVSVTEVIDSTPYTIQYAYNSGSQNTVLTYPSGRQVTRNYDAMGRLSSIVSGTTTLLSLPSYDAAGQTLGFTLGNTVQASFTYNDRLELASLRYVKPGSSTDVLNLGYDYGTTDNGQIQAIHFYTSPGVEDQSKTVLFTYDPWKRLSAARTGTVSTGVPNTWSLAWTYDRLGNRLSQTLVGGSLSVFQPQLTIDPNTNRITNAGFAYDAAGDLTSDGAGNVYTYDGAQRLVQVNSGAAVNTYFGSLRIKKVNGTTTTRYIYSGNTPIAEYVNGSLSREYIYNDQRLLATVSGGTFTYHHPDHLSNRAETDSSGNVVRTYGHVPFGETSYQTGAADKLDFTTYERDLLSGDTGLDYARARFYSSGLGRFMSVDMLSGDASRPQTLNRFSYPNDPVNSADPSGMAGGNWRCLLDLYGNCVGGNYNGWTSNATAGMGLWADPFGPWIDPTRWNPLAEGEARYDSIIHSWGNYDPATGTFLATIMVVGFFNDGSPNGGFVMTQGVAGLTPDELVALDNTVQNIVDTINNGGIPGAMNFLPQSGGNNGGNPDKKVAGCDNSNNVCKAKAEAEQLAIRIGMGAYAFGSCLQGQGGNVLWSTGQGAGIGAVVGGVKGAIAGGVAGAAAAGVGAVPGALAGGLAGAGEGAAYGALAGFLKGASDAVRACWGHW